MTPPWVVVNDLLQEVFLVLGRAYTQRD